ncbi:protein GDAP2 homolog isoform X3 [Neocloeon triangulifer]|uniref:protein GDAP2 homolog isoform X3 n=1 Tax=Neocloeon triangulifer TaxID=2078957 RepID=UPI00286EDB8A|nr:protein GDAP2 homolog isoform X3 [Neocloeon triangulifer]
MSFVDPLTLRLSLHAQLNNGKMRLDAEQTLDAALNVEVVDAAALKPWSQIAPLPLGPLITPGPHNPASTFPCDPKLNAKIVLWVGDISLLNVDAVVNSTNESMTERNPVSDRIYSQAGQELLDEIQNEIKECKTGDVQVTSGHNLPARFIIHTVGPKYNVKYQTAAENSLHSCYRNVLQKACELGVATLAIPAINSVKRNYPPDQGAHIALRTIRRFLDKYSPSFERIVLAVENSDVGIYELLLPLYFPRTEQEELHAARQLPNCVGGSDADDEGLSTQLESLGVGEHAFSQMQGDLDQQRLLGDLPTYNSQYTSETLMREMQNNISYERLLRRARTEDLSEISGIGCLYQSGVDRFGRPVIVFVGKWFKFNEINLEKALLYLIYLLDPLVKGDYVISYFHTLTSSNNYPSFNWLKEVYNILPYKYKKNLKAFYIVHPTFWTKMMTWWFTTFMAPAIKQKVFSLPGVEYLYSAMTPDQLEIPAFITEYDMTINGIRYVNASESG